ncbi:MAG: hypothetical protein ACRDPY_28935, partial [Streptosporangiaceae bacterium]
MTGPRGYQDHCLDHLVRRRAGQPHAQSLTSPALDAWSATRWITRIASQYGLPVAGENPGLNLPASLDTFYTNTTSTGMPVTRSACGSAPRRPPGRPAGDLGR